MNEDANLIARAHEFVDEVWEDVVQDIDYLVQVESVEDRENAREGMPFGPAPRKALDRALEIAGRLGLGCHVCEGYLGYGELTGARDAYIATIAHSDIVPLGRGWTVDPLRVTRKDGYLLGRGVLDDKGPLILSLYAAHFFAREVKRTGERLPYTLRCLVGTNEETNMGDVDYYLKNYPAPIFCFTPDATFPLICGEKGCFHATVTSSHIDQSEGRIVSFEGGTVPNAIPGHAEVVVRAKADELPLAEGLSIVRAGVDELGRALCRIVATGKGGHASLPEGTRNAIGMLVDYLLDNKLHSEEERQFLEFERLLFADTAGEALGIAATDDVFDPLTCIGGTIHTVRDAEEIFLVQTIDSRYPKSTTNEKIIERIALVASEHGCTAVENGTMLPFYVSPDSDEIRTLVGTYNEITGRNERAFTIGGGTYARHFPRAAAFGPDDMFEEKPAWVGIEHGPDEGVSERSLKEALVIYIVSIARLMRLDLA